MAVVSELVYYDDTENCAVRVGKARALVTAFMVLFVFVAFVSTRALQHGRELSAVLQLEIMLASHRLGFRKTGRYPQQPLKVKTFKRLEDHDASTHASANLHKLYLL